ncbi:MAG: hypothetical protein CM15mP74_07800 [Halieaceae bacterium]|nr:MAG: hypothetical protein CM15mP74_07800 [Halieaceae bacterium]
MTTAGAVGAEAQYPVWDRVVRTIHWYFPLQSERCGGVVSKGAWIFTSGWATA